MSPMNVKHLRKTVEGCATQLRDLVRAVAADPELGFEEFHAAARQVEFLQSHGFTVTTPVAGMDTAYMAEFSLGTGQLPTLVIFSEYDALPELGHACGHPLIMGAALGAGCALQAAMRELNLAGRLLIAGSPGEEGKGGKLNMLRAGVLADVDAALACHPFHRTGITTEMLAVSRFDLDFYGRSAHASTAPWDGANALDAMNLLFAGLNAWRQQMTHSSRVHGIITDGGAAANIIPDHTRGIFYVRAGNNEEQERNEARFRRMVEGAALMSDCTGKLERQGNAYAAGIVNPALAAAAQRQMRELGMNPTELHDPLSTDFGNVSVAMPGVNLYFDIARQEALPLHSVAFREAAQTDCALAAMGDIAAVMAAVGAEFFQDGEFRRLVTGK